MHKNHLLLFPDTLTGNSIRNRVTGTGAQKACWHHSHSLTHCATTTGIILTAFSTSPMHQIRVTTLTQCAHSTAKEMTVTWREMHLSTLVQKHSGNHPSTMALTFPVPVRHRGSLCCSAWGPWLVVLGCPSVIFMNITLRRAFPVMPCFIRALSAYLSLGPLAVCPILPLPPS